MNPVEFFYIATHLNSLAPIRISNSSSSLSSPSSTIQPSPEIIRRTYVNRAYYFLYHTARQETLNQLNNDKKIKKKLESLKIDPETLFQDHWILREFYWTLWDAREEFKDELKKRLNIKTTPIESARKVANILSTYNTYRVIADYHVDIHDPEHRGKRLDFSDTLQTPTHWKSLLPSNIQKRSNEILSEIPKTFQQLKTKYPKKYDSYIGIILNAIESE